ncbi:MAG: S41 family peptidase [Chloroflexi bacterium]|nr:S41 family peptidase [Chloroflexota bacterium]
MFKRSSVLGGLLAALIMLLSASFATGYVASRTEVLAGPRAALGALLDRVGLVGAVSAAANAPSADTEQLFRPFWEAWDLIDREYYDQGSVDQQKLYRAAIRGMVDAVGDSHTLYMDPLHRELSDAELRGTFDGIGVQVDMTNQQLRIVAPIPGSPGERAGLRTGDVITQVDGQSVQGLELGDTIRLIRGSRGSSVTITIQRPGAAPFDVVIVRDQIRLEAVTGSVRADGVAYVRITSFTSASPGQLRRMIEQLLPQAPIGWVLDLRGNPGGSLDAAISVTSQFLNDGVVLYEQRRDGQRQEIRRTGDARTAIGPMAVLVDKGSASASEIVAAALRDNGRATLVGEQTFGKGLVQAIHRLSDGSALRLTIARWLTPNQELIQGVGLTPEISASAGSEFDAQSQAVAYVRSQPAAGEAANRRPTNASGASAAPAGRGASLDGTEPIALLDAKDRENASSFAVA